MLHGVDLSHHQAPWSVPWETIAKTSQFVICRATYGTMRDRAVVEHVRRARAVGLRVGLYHFFRPSQDWRDQLAQFDAVADACEIRGGDIVPAVDIEKDGTHGPDPTPPWCQALWPLCGAMQARYGGPLVYTTQADFGRLGKPEWLLQFPLWVAHWTLAKEPATPGRKPWTLWQYRVGRYQPGGPGGTHDAVQERVDHNWAMELPVIAERPSERPPDTERDLSAAPLAKAARHAVDVVREEAGRDMSDENES